MAGQAPSLDLERSLLRTGDDDGPRRIAGMDEVGRGALAGPVAVGVTVVDASTPPAPAAVRDSKLLRPAVREALVPQIDSWAVAGAVGWASAAEIDAVGIVGALRLAGRRALAQLPTGTAPDLVLLDGSHDWLSTPAPDLLSQLATTAQGSPLSSLPEEADPEWRLPVRTVVKGDMTCASIAAASVLAKVERDARMVELHEQFPAYGWAGNKGYGAAVHRTALRERGATDHHRRSWNLGLPS